MNLEGDLQTTPLHNVMLSVSASSGSGILTIQGDDDIVAVSFLNGAIVTADALNQTVEEGLGKVLEGRGLIAREDFDAVVRDHQGGSTGSLGDMLVQRNLINRDEMPMFRNLWDHIGKDIPKKGRGKGQALDHLKIPAPLQTALEALYGHYQETY